MTTESLYVDGYVQVLRQWIEVGASPWLNNSTDNYIYTKTAGGIHQEFTFTDLSQSSGVVSSVVIYFECSADDAPNDDGFDVYIHDGTSWQLAGTIKPSSTTWAWENLNISAILNTVAKIQNAKLYVLMVKVGGADEVYIRKAYLYVDYTPGLVGWTKLQYASEPPSLGWNQLKYASEPPVASAWNKLEYG